MSFTFNGINCEGLGMIVEKYPDRPVPVRKAQSYSIAGRSGNLIVDQDAFENVIQSYDVFIKEDIFTFQRNARLVAQWLVGNAGYKELTDTYDPDVSRLARVVNAMEFVNSLNRFGRGTIQFDCKPQRYPVPEQKFTGVIGDTFIYPHASELFPACPKMILNTISANTSFTIEDTNGLRIVIPARGSSMIQVTVDWETQSVLTTLAGVVPLNMSVVGTWGKLGNGGKVITTLDTGTAPTVELYTRRYYI